MSHPVKRRRGGRSAALADGQAELVFIHKRRWRVQARSKAKLPRPRPALSALAIRICDDSFQRTMSIFSPPSSSTMFLMRLPRTPTQAPTAFHLGVDRADGDLGPMTRLAGQGFELDRAVADFRTYSRSNKPLDHFRWLRLRMILTALGVSRTSRIIPCTRSPGSCCRRGSARCRQMPSTRPRLTIIVLLRSGRSCR